MLATLIPRNGLGSIKRRNSKSYENRGRRDSFSVVNSSLSLPSCSDSLRRVPSYDALLQALGTPQEEEQQLQQQHQMTLQPAVETRLKGRRASISRLISRRPSISRKETDEMRRKKMECIMCDPLDVELARIREKLVSY